MESNIFGGPKADFSSHKKCQKKCQVQPNSPGLFPENLLSFAFSHLSQGETFHFSVGSGDCLTLLFVASQKHDFSWPIGHASLGTNSRPSTGRRPGVAFSPRRIKAMSADNNIIYESIGRCTSFSLRSAKWLRLFMRACV
jgi:hypothetical protein